MKKPILFFLVESPFSERDWDRFGIADLLSMFDVRILDFTPVVHPGLWRSKGPTQILGDRVISIFELSEVTTILEEHQPKACLSNLGEGETRSSLFRELNSCGVLIAEFQLGSMPTPETSSFSSLEKIEFRLKQASSATELPRILVEHWKRRKLKQDLPHIFFRAGTSAGGRHPQLGREIVDVHSLDYEAFRESAPPTSTQVTRNVVYLDQDIGFHSDLQTLRMRSPATPSVFYTELTSYFNWLQDECGLTVVICPHPRAGKKDLANRFPGLKISDVGTAREIYGSCSVLGHVSTSFSFAVLAQRPTLILTSDELTSSWYWPYIQMFTDELKAPLVNLSNVATWIKPEANLLEQQRAAYRVYYSKYLRSYAGPDQRLWKMVGDELLQRIKV